MDKVKEIFEKQLEKCGVDYFDFYLFHNVCEMNIDAYLDPKYGIYRLSDGAEEERPDPPSGLFRPRERGSDAAVSWRLTAKIWSSARSS